MTDQPPEERSGEPTAATPPTPDSPTVISPPPAPIEAPNEPDGGVGFAAIRPPGQPDPPPGPPAYTPGPWSQPPNYQGPPPGYQGPPPGYPPPGYGYAPPPPAPRTGPSVVLVGVLALVLLLVAGIGGLFAFGIGPFARPTPTPIADATTAPPPLATVPPTTTVAPNGATAAPTATAGPTATPIPSGDVASALLTHIPGDFADTCFVSPSGAPIVAIASCTANEGAIEVTYFQYDSQESMFQAYEGFRLTSEIEPDTGSCGDPTTWPAENDYNISEQPAGRLLCTEALGQTSIYWTDDRLNILSQATHTRSDFGRLVEFWESESGPDL